MRFVLLGLLVGCYSPKIQPGAPCLDGVCPSELVCTHTGTCELADSDAPPGSDAPPPADAAPLLDAHLADAPPDVAPPVDGPTQFCYGTGLVTVCFPTMPTGSLTLPLTVDTGGGMCSGVSSTYCVLAAASITVSGTVKGMGPRPLVLIATGTLSIPAGATLDVSAVGAAPGPGGRTSGCAAVAASGASGGAGGGFGTRGGGGGAGPLNGTPTPPATVGPITSFTGGCSGETGAALNGMATSGAGGGGGGAVYLIAQTLDLDGTIDASGEGGAGATVSAGGGGGGSGGFIGLDGALLTTGSTTRLFANGGGGGEGAGANLAGAAGADPTAPDAVAAGGGGMSPSSGDGGDGAYASIAAKGGADGTSPTAGGGGGGGGAGAIRQFGVALPVGPNISPPAQ